MQIKQWCFQVKIRFCRKGKLNWKKPKRKAAILAVLNEGLPASTQTRHRVQASTPNSKSQSLWLSLYYAKTQPLCRRRTGHFRTTLATFNSKTSSRVCNTIRVHSRSIRRPALCSPKSRASLRSSESTPRRKQLKAATLALVLTSHSKN